jgi:putative redox protein
MFLFIRQNASSICSFNFMVPTDFKAIVRYAGDELLIGISPSGHAQVMDTNHERNAAATPVELLMIAVGGCTAVDVVSILKKKRQNLTNYHVEVRGDRRADFPRSFTKFFVHHIVRGRGISSEAVAQAIELSDTKYCSVAATVRPAAEIVTSFEIIEED